MHVGKHYVSDYVAFKPLITIATLDTKGLQKARKIKDIII